MYKQYDSIQKIILFVASAGHYVFIEASNAAPGSKARLNKYQLPVSREATVSFWYHMRGETMGTIRLIRENSGR